MLHFLTPKRRKLDILKNLTTFHLEQKTIFYSLSEYLIDHTKKEIWFPLGLTDWYITNALLISRISMTILDHRIKFVT